jgi:hypothetical protein
MPTTTKRRVVGVLGEPGAGKTELVRTIRRDLGCYRSTHFGLLHYEEYPFYKTLVMGLWSDDPFAGTDKLAKEAREYFALFCRDGHAWLDPEWAVLFEGLGFAYLDTLDTIAAHCDLRIVHLTSTAKRRWTDETPEWLIQYQGRMRRFMACHPTVTLCSDTLADLERNVVAVRGLLWEADG